MMGDKSKKWKQIVWQAAGRLLLVVYDLVVVNAAFYLALLIRFFVANQFHRVAAQYTAAFFEFAPYYSIICIGVFACFRLYQGIWKYAGLNDLNRITFANLICLVVQVIGSCLFVKRMPITYYCIGWALQLFLTIGVRFVGRVFLMEMKRISNSRKRATSYAIIIGTGETSRLILALLRQEGQVSPVCLINPKSWSGTGIMNGIPVVSGVENLMETIQKYRANLIVIADAMLPEDTRQAVRKTCADVGIEARDYSGYFQIGGGLMFKSLAACSTGTIQLIIDGKSETYANGETALMHASGKYEVKAVTAKGDVLVVELGSRDAVLNDLNEKWVKIQEKDTGEAISFF